MINACSTVSYLAPDFSYGKPSLTNGTEPDMRVAIDAMINALGKNAVTDSTTPSYAAALSGLHDNYAQIPKDNNGYVVEEGLQQIADNPEGFTADAVAAARYFLDPVNNDRVNALDASRERYAEGKINIDGEISKEDIESELAHLDPEAEADAGAEPGSIAGRETQTPEPSQDDLDATATSGDGLDTGKAVMPEEGIQAGTAPGTSCQLPAAGPDLAENPEPEGAPGNIWADTIVTTA